MKILSFQNKFDFDQAQTTRVTFTTAGGASIGWATDSAGAPLTLPTITFDNGLASWVMEKGNFISIL